MVEFIDDWRSLRVAPRDGTAVLLAVAPAFGRPGYVAIGWWCAPKLSPNFPLGKLRRKLFDKAGGWWARGKASTPFGRPVLAWQPIPEFDFEAWQEEQDAA